MNLTEITKITPLHTKDWYVKWCSSIVLIVAQVSTAVGVPLFPQYPTTMILYFIGILGWLLVAYWWHDRALIILNAIGAFIMASGILKFYMGVQYMIFEFFYYTFVAMVLILAWMTYDDVRMEKRNNGQYAFVTSALDNN